MYRIIQKLHLNKYINSRLVIVADIVLSLCATSLTYLLIKIIPGLSQVVKGISVYWFIVSLVASLISFYIFKTHRAIIRHSTLQELWKVAAASSVKGILFLILLMLFFDSLRPLDIRLIYILIVDIVLTFTAMVITRVILIVVYNSIINSARKTKCQKVLIFGTGEKSVSIITRLQNSPHYQVVGFLSDSSANYSIAELPVFFVDNHDRFNELCNRYSIEALLFVSEKDAQAQDKLINYCSEIGLKVLIAPTIDEVVDGKIMKNQIREIRIEDLLGRSEIKIAMDEVSEFVSGKVVMVTGAAGSIGSELCRQLAGLKVCKLVLYDNAETPMHYLRLELEERFPELSIEPIIGDVRMLPRLDYAFKKWHPQIVFHAAAYKHVPLMEENPCEAVMVNVKGSRNVADKCLEYGVEKMVMISTDKAVNPTNIMGCTKRLAEIYVQSLGLAIASGQIQGTTKFVTTRFGNVLGSNGSVIVRFREQIAKGGPLTVTDPNITRFFMTIPEACRLVMEAATMSTGNQIFVFDMGKSVKIDTLAKRMIELAGLELGKDIDIEYTGLRPGEKLYEEVLANNENTIPTPNTKIRIAKVREYSFEEACNAVDSLYDLALKVQIDDMVIKMKEIVPEFKSKHSRFEKFDK